jgi:hypothetical protein
LERERELAALGSAVAGASVGEGSGVAVTGNSGTGKSALVEAACTDAHDIRVLRGACDPLRTPRPLGPFRGLSDGRQCDLVHTGEETLLAEVCERVYETLRAEPTVLVVEDVHWIDAASVDVLRFLARRVDAMPLALLLTYRDNEIGPRHSARPLLGDFASLEWLTTLQLGPLSMHAVRTLLAGSRLDPERVHAVTGGNPFFVTEVAKDPQRPLPRSVRDAVLARVRRLRGSATRVRRAGPARRPGAPGPRRRSADTAQARRERAARPRAGRAGLPPRTRPPGDRDHDPARRRAAVARPPARRARTRRPA